MSHALRWERDGADWPNRDASTFVRAGGLHWHVQRLGRGPALLLVHGTGASTHSWRALAPALATRFDVIAPDLPGHGFSEPAQGETCSLPGMARALAALLRALGIRPSLAVGHSAGAAIVCRMSLDAEIEPAGLVALNGAMLPFGGVAWRASSPLAQRVAETRLVARLLAWRASDPAVAERLIRGTGSRLDPEGVHLYHRLVRDPRHVAATLAMMARWDLARLVGELPRLRPELLLVVGDRDRYVPPGDAGRLRARLARARTVHLPRLGHLAHEERPDAVAGLLVRFASAVGAL